MDVFSLKETNVGVVSLRATVVGVVSLRATVVSVFVFKFGGTSLKALGAGVVSRDNYKSHTCLPTTSIKQQKDLLSQIVLEDVTCSVS